MQVRAGLLVHRDDRGARLGEVVDVLLGLHHHQVHVHRQRGGPPDRLDHQGPDGDVGHEAAVHHVHVHVVRSGELDGLHLVVKPAEVSRENRRRDAHPVRHGARGSPVWRRLHHVLSGCSRSPDRRTSRPWITTRMRTPRRRCLRSSRPSAASTSCRRSSRWPRRWPPRTASTRCCR